MDPEYAQRYRQLYLRHWWWRARERMVLSDLEALAPPEGFGDILDIGCGDGLLLGALRRFGRPMGLEADGDLVTDAGRAKGKITVAPFDERFDPGVRFGLIVMLDVLEHLDDDRAALAHVHRLLRPGGVLYVTVPAFRTLWTRHDDINQHRTRYTRRRLNRRLVGAGFEVDRSRYFFHWLVPLKLAVRLTEALKPGEPKPAAVPGAPFNRLALGMSLLEQRTWGHLPWPVGSSLLAVSRRAPAG